MQHSRMFTRQELDRYFASYVGMEGGNPGAAVWICDRSPAWSEPVIAPLNPPLAPPAWDAGFRQQHRQDMARWFGHQCVARIMAAARAEALGVRLGDNDWEHYYWSHLYSPAGAEFRLSLFPLPAHVDGRTTWSKAFRGQPELIPQKRYAALCREGERFRFIARTCERWRPKVVICLSHRHTDEYIEAFSLDGIAGEEHALRPADQARRLHLFTRDDTTWIICPAIGGSAGMTSQVQLDAFGKFIGMRLAASDFKHCLELAAHEAPARPEHVPEPYAASVVPVAAAGRDPGHRIPPGFGWGEPVRAGNCESFA